MTTTLTGEVGRSGRAEDVAIVQALLASIRGPDGRALWDRRIDSRPGAELAIDLGFALWNEHRFPIRRGTLVEAPRRRKAVLNTRRGRRSRMILRSSRCRNGSWQRLSYLPF